jgi:hypothetical protein
MCRAIKGGLQVTPKRLHLVVANNVCDASHLQCV